jgi:hypothetical protein
MKIKHRSFTPGWSYIPPSHVESDDRYLGELETARRKAEKAWRKAREVVKRSERLLAAKADPDLKAALEAAIAEFERRARELRLIEQLMRAPSGQPRIAQRTGRDNRLEIGEYQPPKRKKRKKMPVKVTRKP